MKHNKTQKKEEVDSDSDAGPDSQLNMIKLADQHDYDILDGCVSYKDIFTKSEISCMPTLLKTYVTQFIHVKGFIQVLRKYLRSIEPNKRIDLQNEWNNTLADAAIAETDMSKYVDLSLEQDSKKHNVLLHSFDAIGIFFDEINETTSLLNLELLRKYRNYGKTYVSDMKLKTGLIKSSFGLHNNRKGPDISFIFDRLDLATDIKLDYYMSLPEENHNYTLRFLLNTTDYYSNVTKKDVTDKMLLVYFEFTVRLPLILMPKIFQFFQIKIENFNRFVYTSRMMRRISGLFHLYNMDAYDEFERVGRMKEYEYLFKSKQVRCLPILPWKIKYPSADKLFKEHKIIDSISNLKKWSRVDCMVTYIKSFKDIQTAMKYNMIPETDEIIKFRSLENSFYKLFPGDFVGEIFKYILLANILQL